MKPTDYKFVGVRRFYQLQPGDIFRAVIHNIRPGEVVIRLAEGELYVARSLVLPPGHIGDECLFCVKENDFKGRIVLEVVKTGTSYSFDMRV
ncbi:MAG: hypothetical protein FWC70_04025 [Defluviitaleaceae bacterium]|nr:hypothetical protein [Defluviitaleaceae bacterium]